MLTMYYIDSSVSEGITDAEENFSYITTTNLSTK
jgi:hypothetical protein